MFSLSRKIGDFSLCRRTSFGDVRIGLPDQIFADQLGILFNDRLYALDHAGTLCRRDLVEHHSLLGKYRGQLCICLPTDSSLIAASFVATILKSLAVRWRKTIPHFL